MRGSLASPARGVWLRHGWTLTMLGCSGRRVVRAVRKGGDVPFTRHMRLQNLLLRGGTLLLGLACLLRRGGRGKGRQAAGAV